MQKSPWSGYLDFLQKKNRSSVIGIAFAYVGALTGAGLASGQELMQYFMAFGLTGVKSVILVAILHFAFGGITVSLGSFFLAREQGDVLGEIAPPLIQKILDLGLMATCFIIGFVMIAGAGSNLHQEFGLPLWVGSVICTALVVILAFFDFNKVSAIIGAFTPVILAFILVAAIYVAFFTPIDLAKSETLALLETTTLPNPWVSVLNYFSMCLMTGASIAFVLGGEEYYLKNARIGGFIGGGIVGLITLMEVVTLYAAMPIVSGTELPMLTILTRIHPAIGTIAAIVIYGMIFNTAVSLYYALARRLVGKDPKKFVVTMQGLALIGFGLSFFGFKKLLSIFYPIVGYLGFVLILVLLISYIRTKSEFLIEQNRRTKVFTSLMRKLNPAAIYRRDEDHKVKKLVRDSHIDDHTLATTASQEAKETWEAYQELSENEETADEETDEAPENTDAEKDA